MKILIADDDLTIRSILQTMTSEWGFEPQLESDGASAWEDLQKKDPAKILLIDWEMPGLDGLQLCKLIRKQSTENPPYIILLTARREAKDIAEGLQAGANDYISKPFQRIELEARLKVAKRVIKLQQQRLISLADAQLAASVFSHASEGIVITDRKGIIINANHAFCDITGYSHEDCLNQSSSSFLQEDNKQAFDTIKTTGKWQSEYDFAKKNGFEITIQLSISTVYNLSHQVTNYICLISDISEKKRHQLQLQFAASHDSLTKLANRSLLKDRLSQAMARVRRDDDLLAVIYLDLDGFKAINDQLGHAEGDKLLVTIASKLKEVLRETDTVARIGGDEFVILLTKLKHQKDSQPTLDRILKACLMHFKKDRSVLEITASLGVSYFSKNNPISQDSLFQQADSAMYEAKKSGKNCIKYFQEKKPS